MGTWTIQQAIGRPIRIEDRKLKLELIKSRSSSSFMSFSFIQARVVHMTYVCE